MVLQFDYIDFINDLSLLVNLSTSFKDSFLFKLIGRLMVSTQAMYLFAFITKLIKKTLLRTMKEQPYYLQHLPHSTYPPR
jgi:hypothetical protein